MYGKFPSSQKKVFLNGLKNTPTTFMRMMDDIVWPFTNSFVVVYIDDILVYKKTWA